MSVSRVVIPQLELEQNDDPHNKIVMKGAKQISTQLITQNGTANQNECNFSFQPPSQNTVLDRRIDLVLQLKVKLANSKVFNSAQGTASNVISAGTRVDATGKSNFQFFENHNAPISTEGAASMVEGANSGVVSSIEEIKSANRLQGVGYNRFGNTFCPRQFPLHSIIDNIDLTLNGTHFSTDPNKYIKAVQQYTTPEFRNHTFNETAHHPDTYEGDYETPYLVANYPLRANPIHNGRGISLGEGRLGEQPRGVIQNNIGLNKGLVQGNVGTCSADNTELTYTFVEPLMISPLCAAYGKGMTNINNIDVSCKFRSNLKMAFSLLPTTNILNLATNNDLAAANFSVEVVGTPQLRIRNFTPQDDIKIPNEIVMEYYQPRRFESVIAPAIVVDTEESKTTNNRRLDQIPEALYLWVGKTFAKEEMVRSDGYGELTNVNITFGNQVGILSKHTQDQLRELAIENGCDLLDANEAREKGYCLKLIFGKDIPLADNESPGTRGDYNIQIEAKFKFQTAHSDASSTALQEMYVNCGQAIVSPNECRVQTGLLDLKDNIDAENMGHHYALADDVAGAGLFDSLSKYAKKVPHLARSVVRHAPAIVATAKLAHAAVKDPSMGNVMAAGQAAMGLRKDMKGGSLTGGSVSGGSMTGGSITGGYRSRRR